MSVDRKKAIEQANSRLIPLTRAFYRHLDSEIAAQKDAAGVTCKSGCAHCCRQLVFAYGHEVAYIMSRHRALVRKQLPVLQADAVKFARIMHKMPPNALQNPLDRSIIAGRYWNLGLTCAFLTEDKRCGIYEERPFVCRSYHVTSDPRICSGKYGTEAQHHVWHPTLTRPPSTKLESQQGTVGHLPTLLIAAL